jgi:NDP-sugar pyrophosphorylase family protein
MKHNMQAVILAAGKGLRMRPLTETTPKTLLPLNGIPLLEHILEALPEEIQEIFLVVGYLKEQIMDRIGGIWHGKTIHYVVQNPLDGTGSAIHLLKQYLHERFFILNGDDLYTKKDLERLIAHPLAILVSPTKDSITFSALADETGLFAGFESNAPSHEIKQRVCGAYILDERFFRYPLAEITVHNQKEYSLPHTLVAMSRDCPIKLETASFWQPVGTLEEYELAKNNCHKYLTKT